MTHTARQDVALAFAQLCAWAAGVKTSDLPRAVLRRSARILLDDLAAMVGGAQAPEVSAYQQHVARHASAEEASIFGIRRKRVGRAEAAVANAIACNWLELDEGYRPVPCHAGLYVIPSLLASAEGRVSTEDVLRVLAVSYELVTRVARAFTVPIANMQSHGRYSALGAAAASALTCGLNGRQLHSALCAAATLITPAPRNHLAAGAMVRNVWPAVGAWSGMMAVQWSELGMGGLEGALFDVYSTVLGGTAVPNRLTADLGSSWAVLDGYTKLYACCQHLHSAVEAALDLSQLMRDNALDTNEIEAIEVASHPLALPLSNEIPTTILGAKFSMQHAVAASLILRTGGAAAFDDASLRNESIGRLRRCISLRLYDPLLPAPHDRPACVSVRFVDGNQISQECLSAVGGPDRPLNDAAVIEKARGLTEQVYPSLVPVMTPLLQLDEELLCAPWTLIVDAAFNPSVEEQIVST